MSTTHKAPFTRLEPNSEGTALFLRHQLIPSRKKPYPNERTYLQITQDDARGTAKDETRRLWLHSLRRGALLGAILPFVIGIPLIQIGHSAVLIIIACVVAQIVGTLFVMTCQGEDKIALHGLLLDEGETAEYGKDLFINLSGIDRDRLLAINDREVQLMAVTLLCAEYHDEDEKARKRRSEEHSNAARIMMKRNDTTTT